MTHLHKRQLTKTQGQNKLRPLVSEQAVLHDLINPKHIKELYTQIITGVYILLKFVH